MRILCDIIFFLFFLFSVPYYLIKGKMHKGILSRFGFSFGKDFPAQCDVWIHAVSVGETLAIKPLFELLSQNAKVCISTTTPTGNKIARGMVLGRPNCFAIFSPLDFSFVVDRFIERLKPKVFVLVETELWPNLITGLYKKSIPIVLVNGRISDRSFARYMMVRFFIKNLLAKISMLCMRGKIDAERIIAMGADLKKVKVAGNMKFDTAPPADISIYTRHGLGLFEEDTLLIAASTHEGEEQILIDALKPVLLERDNKIRLLLAPRNVKRFDEAYRIINKSGFKALRLSRMKGRIPASLGGCIFLLDTMGELLGLYSIGDIVFMGGSLVDKGGHNAIEPALFSKPVITGPYNSNFQDVVDIFLDNDAIARIEGSAQLKDAVCMLAKDRARSKNLGANANKVVLANRGASLRTYETINDTLKKGAIR